MMQVQPHEKVTMVRSCPPEENSIPFVGTGPPSKNYPEGHDNGL